MNRSEAQALSKQSLEELGRQLEAGRSESLARFLDAVAKFHQYSWGNVMMILAQKPDATQVAGIRTWNRLGRYVRKGEKGLGFFAPMRFKEKEGTGSGEEEDRIAFRVVHVFDLSQTDGVPLPEPETVAGEPSRHLEELKRVVTEKGIALEYADDLGDAKGKSCRGTVKLRQGMTPAEEYAVLSHELAHELMHLDRRGMDRQRAELEAEAVASVLCRYAGLQSGTAHSDYIHLYEGGKEALSESLQVIQKTAADIIEAMAGKEEVFAAGEVN